MNREDAGQTERPDSEVKTPYRRFSAKEKLRILEEADACTEPGEIGALMADHFPEGAYRDVPGLCRVATLEEIEAQDWSLNPGRYVGVPEREEDADFDFEARLVELHDELEMLNAEAHELEARISENVISLLEATASDGGLNH